MLHTYKKSILKPGNTFIQDKLELLNKDVKQRVKEDKTHFFSKTKLIVPKEILKGDDTFRYFNLKYEAIITED